jgi:hypothetical protein
MLISKFPLWICALALGGALTVHAQDNPAQAAARAALQQKMNELDANPAATTPAPEAAPAATAPVASAPAAAPAVVAPAAAIEAAPVVETPAPAATAPADTAVETPAPAQTEPVTPTEVKASVTKPTPSSAPAISKDERLMLLLARYKADQITPEQYHTQRAAILAEP